MVADISDPSLLTADDLPLYLRIVRSPGLKRVVANQAHVVTLGLRGALRPDWTGPEAPFPLAVCCQAPGS